MRNLVVRCVAILKPQIVVFQFDLDKGENQFVLDHLPDDAGHLVAVHFDDGVLRLNHD